MNQFPNRLDEVVAAEITGEGTPIILLHGFPMNRKIWKAFGASLTASYKVVAVDLPGFGDSPIIDNSFSIADVAREIVSFVHEGKLFNGVLIGHSLGGYVALQMMTQAPDLFRGIVLFHSTAMADTDEKKQSRTKVIDFVRKNGVDAFLSTFVPTLFHQKDNAAIPEVATICKEATEQAVIGFTAAMRDRPATIESLKKLNKPVLFLGGENDGVIPPTGLAEQAASVSSSQLEFLPETGHMGMYESLDLALEKISLFIRKVTVTIP